MKLSMKWFTLLLLVLQTVASVMLIRVASVYPVSLFNEESAGEDVHRAPVRFLNTTVVALAEVFKFVASFFVLWAETGFRQPVRTLRRLRSSLFSNPADTLKLGVPAALYTLQNNLVFVALANLSGAVYQVTYQMKILTTALLSVAILGKRLSISKWASLLVLTSGVILIQLATLRTFPQAVKTGTPTGMNLQSSSTAFIAAADFSSPESPLVSSAAWGENGVAAATDGERETHVGETAADEFGERGGRRQLKEKVPTNNTGDMTAGLAAVCAACLTSALAGVYLEKLLQEAPVSIWVRNIQLSVFGMIFGFTTVYWNDTDRIQDGGFFQGYTLLVWAILLLQGVGGLIVAAVLKYADNILKCFGNASSILLSCLLSWWVLGDYYPTPLFCLGAFLVVFATCAYTFEIPWFFKGKGDVASFRYYMSSVGRSASDYAPVSRQAFDKPEDEEIMQM